MDFHIKKKKKRTALYSTYIYISKHFLQTLWNNTFLDNDDTLPYSTKWIVILKYASYLFVNVYINHLLFHICSEDLISRLVMLFRVINTVNYCTRSITRLRLVLYASRGDPDHILYHRTSELFQ